MKTAFYLLACAAGLASCSTSPAAPVLSPVQAQVSAYLKKTLDDPASYQPVSWGKVTPFQQREIDGEKAKEESAEFDQQIALAKIENEGIARLGAIEGIRVSDLAPGEKAVKLYAHRADSVSKIIDKLTASTDTTRLGLSVRHAFRAKNKMGALVLDSARFIVLRNGTITATK